MSNKFKFILPKSDTFINLPIEMKWDFYGRDDSIDVYEKDVLEDLVGKGSDFEIVRFGHAPYSSETKTALKYNFYFYSVLGGVPSNPSTQVLTASQSDWVTSYLPEGFLSTELYYYVRPFTQSFFKLDFYDTKDTISQTNYFTAIIPVQQGATETASISPYKPLVQIKKPEFTLDYVGDKEGFFLYWLRKKNFFDINPNNIHTTETFYMTAKFFDARLGVFVKMINENQASTLIHNNPFNFQPERYFYYKVVLNYVDNTYKIFDWQDVRVGEGSPIKWYEYITP